MTSAVPQLGLQPLAYVSACARPAPILWPLSSAMSPLASTPIAPGYARAHLRTVLHAWRMDRVIEDGELIVSELVANAVTASATDSGRPRYIEDQVAGIWVCLLSDWASLRLEVWDQAPGIPVRRYPESVEEGGRGLALVEALSLAWGFWPALPANGKCVWAELRL